MFSSNDLGARVSAAFVLSMILATACASEQDSETGTDDLDPSQLVAEVGVADSAIQFDYPQSLHNNNGGRCMDVLGSNSDNGADVGIWDCNGGANQKWTLSSDGTIRSRLNNKCLDIYGWDPNNGASVRLWDCSGGANQRWWVNDNGTIQSQWNGKCLEVHGGGDYAGALVAVWDCHGGANQRWVPDAAGYTVWNCFETSNGNFHGTVSINWGHTTAAAEWACDAWISECGSNGGCKATGGDSCNIIASSGKPSRMDGCSAPGSDPATNHWKGVFHDACNNHDACYHAPWSRIAPGDWGSGMDRCNNNFWNEMNIACGSVPWYDWLGCKAAASVWASAMNFSPGRESFWSSFVNDQNWVNDRCVQ